MNASYTSVDDKMDPGIASSRALPETILCPHCECYLAKKTFKRHRHLYFNKTTEEWTKECPDSGDDEPFDEVDFLMDHEPDVGVNEGTQKDMEEPPIVNFDSDSDMEHLGEDLCKFDPSHTHHSNDHESTQP